MPVAFRLLTVFLWTLLSLGQCNGAIYERASDLPGLRYDFVIIGGGTAGNTVANRLTEAPEISVLVLEAGVSNEGVLDSIVPFLGRNLRGNTPFNWNFTTTPQNGLNGRSIPYKRGHMLGGCSSLNGMLYTRGSSDDFDRYAKVTGDPGWSWNNLQTYIRRNEMWTLPADHHNTAGQFDPADHSFTGINSVSLAGFPRPIDARIIRTTKELSEEFPFNLDMNSGKPLGVGWLQGTIKGGRRSSSATSYLGPEVINRPNLHVLLHARVTRLIQTSSNKEKLAFNGVEFAQESDMAAPRHQVTASKEVILSAGTVGTPHILMHSGIGDEKALNAVGVKPILHLPGVGKNVSDHPVVANAWFVNSTETLDDISRNSTLFSEVFQRWNETQTGPFVDPTGSHIAWLRLPSNASIFEQFPDPSAGPHTAHLELVTENGIGLLDVPPAGHFISIGTAVVSPLGRGSIILNSSDPFAPPLIDPGLLSTEFDLFAMRSAVRGAQRFLSAPVWSDYVLEPFGDLANAITDAQLDYYIRNNAGTTSHMVGSAAMSKEDAKYGVVNPDLRLKGVAGLRIIDASVLPFIPSAHTQAATYVIGERGADLVKAAWE